MNSYTYIYKMKLAFAALCLLLCNYMESVETTEDLVVQYYDKNISTIDLLKRLNLSYRRFDLQAVKCHLLQHSCETVCPLDNEDRERMDKKMCYCDKLCVELGDCCYDYFLRCTAANAQEPQLPKRTCVKQLSSDKFGYAMVDSCPQHNTDKKLEFLCTAGSTKADLFGMLPVSDFQNKTTYKNIFCAMCNQASNLTYWKFSASCEGFSSHDIPTNRSLMLSFIMTHPQCVWYFEPARVHSEKVCLALEHNCPDSELVDEEPLLRDLCSFYTVPFCPYSHQNVNPHCDICQGKRIGWYTCFCLSGGPNPGIPSLKILFDFSSSSPSLQVGDTKTVVKTKVCAPGFVFDPFAEKCVQTFFPISDPQMDLAIISGAKNRSYINGLQVGTYFPISDPEMDLANISGSKNRSYIKGLQVRTNISCSHVEINISSVTLLANGSIWIPLHQRIYNKESYVINGSLLLLCADFKRAYTVTEALVFTKISPLQIITYIGCTISMISLISLLGIYIALPELRTLPGKNLISLSCAMLLYQIFFLLTGQTDKPNLCMTVSVLLHYFLLTSFCWMGVMAFDVKKTFGAKGPTRSGHDDNRKALVKYSIFAWTTPAVIVLTSVTLDKTNTFIIGYAKVFCWISNGKALLLVLGVPVAIILLFNVVALTLTMISIWKTRKSTRRVADQSIQTSLPILCIKLSLTMGFTWILAFIEPFTQVEFLGYAFVILNSLQGFFIFLSFVANKRTINKVRAGWRARFHRVKNTDKATTQSRQTHCTKLATTAL